MPLYEALRPATRIWYALHLKEAGSVPRPRDLPSWRPADSGFDSVLLLGNGPCHGWGVATHALALTGQLGRELPTRTQRPCGVDYIGDETMNLAAALPWLGNRELGAYDSIAVVLGVNDAVRLTPVAEWTKGLRRLLDTLLDRAAPEVPILLAGIQPPSSVPMYQTALGAVADRHARRLNAASASIAADYDRVRFFPLGAADLTGARPYGSPEAYAEWASMLADQLAPVLNEQRVRDGGAVRALPDLSPVSDWAGIDQAIELAAEGGSAELQRIAREAKRRFGVEIATVSLVDGDRLRYAMPGGLPSVVPLELTFCKYAVEQPDPLVVPDARRDPRFKVNPFREVAFINFYAGHPLQSLSGDTIGTFCLMGVRPRSASAVDLDAFSALAMQAQDELHRIERGAALSGEPAGQPVESVAAPAVAQTAEKTTRSR
ncbi:GAF domain-containing protein [Naasia aerilata]|uniref:GAF domain-containing protein n=1 Tax=Naasia aerilata TaxID=1162966 RepID=A0ABM8GFL3_9MICO|nr:GAF domain-containing protein [Naasia aerilata]BDZ47130.1 hypothetical protein GCM10025866_30390 [Naasia aerilata]